MVDLSRAVLHTLPKRRVPESEWPVSETGPSVGARKADYLLYMRIVERCRRLAAATFDVDPAVPSLPPPPAPAVCALPQRRPPICCALSAWLQLGQFMLRPAA